MLYTEYKINKLVDSIIKDYAKFQKKWGFDLDKLEKKQTNLERDLIENVNSKNYQYTKQCNEVDNVINLIQLRFDYYFKVGNGYNWLNGNNNFKILLDK